LLEMKTFTIVKHAMYSILSCLAWALVFDSADDGPALFQGMKEAF